MRTASCLTLIAVGAIFTFAISASPSFLNLQVAGVIIMLTGVAGLLLPKPATGWLRRRTVLRRGPRVSSDSRLSAARATSAWAGLSGGTRATSVGAPPSRPNASAAFPAASGA